jgi:hypothetical protein
VFQMLDQYRVKYAAYLESLPEDKRQEELQNQQKRKATNLKLPSSKTATKSSKVNVGE